MKTIITGSSGLVGQAFIENSGKKLEVTRAIRDPDQITKGSNDFHWSPLTLQSEIPKADTLVHLAGESIVGIWTEEKKKRLIQSRVKATKILCESLIKSNAVPNTMIVASGIGIYGDRGDEILDETSSYGDNFLARLAQDWEEATAVLEAAGTRVIKTRIAVVLSNKGGALKQMLPAFQLGLGGPLGSGNQWMSWITLQDLVSAMQYCIENKSISGPVNLCSPEPINNNHFTKTLGKALNRPTWARVPEFILRKLGGELAENILLGSVRAKPKKLLDAGFKFKYPHIEEAFANIEAIS